MSNFELIIVPVLTMTGDPSEVCSDKRKQREDRKEREKRKKREEKERKRERNERRREKNEGKRERERKREKDVQGQLLSICIQFSILNSMMFHDAP